MSDMDVSDIPAPAADGVVPEVAAPAVVEEAAAAPAVEAAPEVVPVLQQSPSSDAQVPEAAPAAEREPVPLKDAAKILVTLIGDGRRAGDGDVDAAVDDVNAAIAAEEAKSSGQ